MKVPNYFVETLKTLDKDQLAFLVRELANHPVDRVYLAAVIAEIKTRK